MTWSPGNVNLKPELIPLPIEQVNHLSWEEAIQHINKSSHLSRAGQALVHPKPNVKAFEEVGLDEGGEPILAPDLLVRIEAEMDCALQRSPI